MPTWTQSPPTSVIRAAILVAMVLLPAIASAATNQLYVKGKELVIGAEADGKMTEGVFTAFTTKVCNSLGNFTNGPTVMYTSSTSYPGSPFSAHALILEFVDKPGTSDTDLAVLGETTVRSGKATVYANRVAAFVKKYHPRAVDAYHAIAMHELGHACGIADDLTTISDEFFSRGKVIIGAASRWRDSDQATIIRYFNGPSDGINTGNHGTTPPDIADGTSLGSNPCPITVAGDGWMSDPGSWDVGAAVETLTPMDARVIALGDAETRWFRIKNPYGSVPGGDPSIYGTAPASLRIKTQQWYGEGNDTVLQIMVPDGAGGFQRIYGDAYDDISSDDRFSQVDVTLNPGDECYIGVSNYYGYPTDYFELVTSPLDQVPTATYITESPYAFDGDWTGDVAAGETKYLFFRVPSSGQWEFRTEAAGGSIATDDTVLRAYTVVDVGPQQLYAGTNDDVRPGVLWSALQGNWIAGTYVILELSGYDGQTVRSTRLRAIKLASPN